MEIITQYLEAETNTSIIHRHKKQQWERSEFSFGDVNIADFVYMYKKMQFHNHQNLGFEQLTNRFPRTTTQKLPGSDFLKM